MKNSDLPTEYYNGREVTVRDSQCLLLLISVGLWSVMISFLSFFSFYFIVSSNLLAYQFFPYQCLNDFSF